MARQMTDRGFTLLELMFSLVIFGVTAAGMTGSFAQLQQLNWSSQLRSEAIGAAQQVLDELRITDPTSLPTTGSATQDVTVGSKTFTVETSYCSDSSFCTSTNIRHLRIGVSYLGKTRYHVDTIFSQLR